jgi:hypothetical protein
LAGRPVACRIVSDEAAVEPPLSAAPIPAVNRSASLDSMKKNAFVQQVTSIFGGTVVDVRPVSPSGSQEA